LTVMLLCGTKKSGRTDPFAGSIRSCSPHLRFRI
jgi:hypothetical protein